jgi:methionyl-tRNA formyltransferase
VKHVNLSTSISSHPAAREGRDNNILLLSDNAILLEAAIKISQKHALTQIFFACSQKTSKACERLAITKGVAAINVKKNYDTLIRDFALVISMHCTQIFPPELVKAVRCINFHPGLNPHNRGWFPQVFSILNGKPFGVTIHEMDTQIDHGPIIYQEEIPIGYHETSEDAYKNAFRREIELLDEWFPKLIAGNYQTFIPIQEGNYNSKADFEALKAIDLDKPCTPRGFINFLRAMTFRPYQNAYFVDMKSGVKQFVRIEIESEQ